MDDKLFTQQDLADRWQVTKRCIENWRKEGVLQPVKGIPAIRFSPFYIAELEGVKLDKFSPLLCKRMEKEIERLEKENEKLRNIVTNVIAETTEAIKILAV